MNWKYSPDFAHAVLSGQAHGIGLLTPNGGSEATIRVDSITFDAHTGTVTFYGLGMEICSMTAGEILHGNMLTINLEHPLSMQFKLINP
jgi:hypothetical protein